MNPAQLHKTSKLNLILNLEAYNQVYEDLMEQMVMIREELLFRLTQEKKDGELIGDYSVTKAKRITFKTTLEQAEELGAIKKAVDPDILRKLLDKGIKVPGVQKTFYLSVKKLISDEAKV